MASRPPASAAPGSLFDRLGGSLELVERTIQDQFASASAAFPAIAEHVLSSGGKRIRPVLMLLAAELCGYTGPRRIPIAAAVELLHTATLLHDDVVDLATLRRGRPAANVVWGNRRAVLAGDFLYARASSLIVEDGDLDILWMFSQTIRRMAEGEILQLERSFDASIAESDYYAVIDRKSAALLSAACEAGAVLAGATPVERRGLAAFGRELGLAFQLRDDALDYTAGEEVLGKQRYTDLREGKVTLPLLLTLRRCTPGEREEIQTVLKTVAAHVTADPEAAKPGARTDFERQVAPLLRLVERHGGVFDTVRRAREHGARAAAALAPFSDRAAKEELLSAADFAVARDR